MRLVIDMQGAQSSGSRNRGIGRYTTSFVKALLQLQVQDEVFLVLNGAFANTIEPIKAEFAGLVASNHMCVWTPPQPCHAADPKNTDRRQAAELIREAFIATLQPDAVLVTSLFEGLGDDAVTSVGLLTSTIPTVVVLYDLIPLIHRGIYLGNSVVEGWYLNKLDQLRRANLLLSISASSGREGVEHLGFNDHQVVNISTACDAHFRPMLLTEARRAELASRYGLHHPFVMYTGGIDHRKNIEGLIRAYAALPLDLRAAHQLAVVCSAHPTERDRLQQLAKSNGLAENELVMTGFVPEEDLVGLYNACKIFVFPSWHEGFGLPALEAMACGRAVIGSNTSSVPEVIGRDDALFDPRSDQAITAKMVQVLTDDTFRCALESHGLQQAKVFSWLNTAQCAWDAIRRLSTSAQVLPVAARRPRLAYLSPVPIGKSGIADYSAELLPELARHYQIDVVVCQDEPMQDSWLLANCPVRSVAWFRTHAKYFDRVLYHFGNSHFHGHMFGLLREIPGIVVLHDFFLSGIVAHMDVHRQNPGCWSRALLVSHGWPAVQMRHTVKDTADAVWAYPCNLPVLQNALGVIVHSENSIRLAEHWYGNAAAKNWALVPHMRVPVYGTDKMASRAALAVAFSDFVVCSFGMLGPTKLNHRLLQAWIASPLATSPQCRLVFVGQNDGGEYGIAMVNAIANSRARVTITGWTDVDVYRQWLSTTDVAVQLRTHSRGETSGTVLDCMNFSVATIVNAHGSMRDLPNNAVYKLPDEFTDDQLVDALTELWKNEQHRLNLGQHGRQLILSKHQPRHCADLYKKAIENFDAYSVTGSHGVTNLCGALVTQPVDTNRQQIAQALAINFSPIPRRKQLLLDVTGLVLETKDNDTHRIVRSLLLPLLQHPPAGWQVEPVYAVVHGSGYQYARRFTCGFLGLPSDWTADDVVEAWSGDTFLVLNSHPSSIPPQAAVLEGWHVRGVKLYAVLYDLLPLLLPHAFVDGATQEYQQWLTAIADFDGVLAVSRTVADEFLDWLAAYGRHSRKLPLNVHYFHLGVDVENTSTTTGYLKPAIKALERVALAPTFLMVGTIEPFKGHQLVLDAFNVLWEQGADLNLVIVGKQGCLVEAFIEQLRNHPQIGLHLHWLEGASDECLGTFYDKSTCIIAAGEGVGFDLPLIEAARFKLPIIARDIPIFREVAAEHAFYFPTDANVDSLAQSISQWLVLYRTRSHPVSESMPWMTWSESATQINTILEGVPPYKTWLPDGVTRFWGNDIRLSTQVGLRRGRAMHSSGSEGFLVFGPYRPLAIGQYKVILSGVAKHWTGEETFDMSCTGGDTRLLHAELSAEPIGAWYKEFQFDLSHHVNDLETRLWVTTQTKLCLNSIEIIEIN